MSAKCHDLHTRQTELFAELYPVFAENHNALVCATSAGRVEPIAALNAGKWLFNKYRQQAEREGFLDDRGRFVFNPAYPSPSHRAQISLSERRAA